MARLRDRQMEGGWLFNHQYEFNGIGIVRVRGRRAAWRHIRHATEDIWFSVVRHIYGR